MNSIEKHIGESTAKETKINFSKITISASNQYKENGIQFNIEMNINDKHVTTRYHINTETGELLTTEPEISPKSTAEPEISPNTVEDLKMRFDHLKSESVTANPETSPTAGENIKKKLGELMKSDPSGPEQNPDVAPGGEVTKP